MLPIPSADGEEQECHPVSPAAGEEEQQVEQRLQASFGRIASAGLLSVD